jgi:phosphonate transport system permease protein
MKARSRKPPDANQQRKPSFVHPVIAAIASLLLPGLGQLLVREYRRGLIMIPSFVTLIGLLAWRMQLTARFDTEWSIVIPKAMRLDPFLVWVTVFVVILYIWTAVDAYLVARPQGGRAYGLYAILLIVYFAFGWQIGQINLVTMFSQASDAGPALARVLWPWDRAITYPTELHVVKAEVLSPCIDTTHPDRPRVAGEPYLRVSPTCGNPSDQDGTTGTELTLYGDDFEPGVEAEIWWRDPIGNEFRQRQGGEYIRVTPDDDGTFEITIIMPYRLLPPGLDTTAQVWEVQTRQVASVGAAEISTELKLVVEKMVETIFIGMMATLFGIVFAIPLSFVAARNLMSASPLTLSIYYIMRALLNIVRSIEPLIWAIIFILIVGLGPFAGILALTVHSLASLGKLYSEAIESIDPGPIEAIQATGANWVQTVIFAVLPQVIPPFVSFTIYRWDINIRMSTIIGFVGGGGIGFLLAQWIRLLDYRAAGLAIWFITITVAILDYVSAEIRARFV